jgi:hypothetical protein
VDEENWSTYPKGLPERTALFGRPARQDAAVVVGALDEQALWRYRNEA